MRIKSIHVHTADSTRLIDTITDGSFYCKVYFDSDLKEYVCKLYEGGIYHAPADYFTDDKQDALSTARDMVRRLKANSKSKDSTKDGGRAVVICNNMLAQLRNATPGDIRQDTEFEASRVASKLDFMEGVIVRLRAELRELG